MKSVLLALIAIISLGFAVPSFAAEVPFPVLPTDNWTGTDVKTFYPTNSSYIVQISVHYQVENPLDVINSITWFDVTGQSYTINLQDEFTLAHFPTDEEIPKIPIGVYTPEDIDKILDEKRQDLLTSADNGFSKLRTCLTEFEEEQPVRFQAWVRTADLTEFDIPDQWISSDHYDRAELEAQKKWVICDMLKQYQFIGAYEANKVIDDLATFSLVETDSPDTVDVTQEAIDAEAKRAADYACSNAGVFQGLCPSEFSGENRGSQEYSLPLWYGAWQDMNAQETDTQRAIEEALVSQCTNYYHLYEHKKFQDSFPHWLEHCIPP